MSFIIQYQLDYVFITLNIHWCFHFPSVLRLVWMSEPAVSFGSRWNWQKAFRGSPSCQSGSPHTLPTKTELSTWTASSQRWAGLREVSFPLRKVARSSLILISCCGIESQFTLIEPRLSFSLSLQKFSIPKLSTLKILLNEEKVR